MLTKLIAGVVAAAVVGGTGLYFAGATSVSTSEDCCFPGSPCCEAGAACCPAPAAKADCCEPGSTCCEPGAACCEAAPAAKTGDCCENCDKCFTGVICCDPPRECCGVADASKAKATKASNCCGTSTSCCTK